MSKHWYNNGTRQLLTDNPPEGFIQGKLPVTPETRLKMSLRRKGRAPSSKGVPCPAEKRRKISETLARRWQEGAFNSRKKKPPTTPETIAKIKAARAGYTHSQLTREKIGNSNRGKPKRRLNSEEQAHRLAAIYQTHKKNNTFNCSAVEDRYYDRLVAVYGVEDVVRQYFDSERYPFHCDFYIKSKDLFIELNLHWTHGGKPFLPDDAECQSQLQTWQQRALKSEFYLRAIHTWTDLDVRKQTIAQNNHLNYICFYTEKQLFNESIATLTA